VGIGPNRNRARQNLMWLAWSITLRVIGAAEIPAAILARTLGIHIQVQRLTLDNHQLRQALEAAHNLTRLRPSPSVAKGLPPQG
jgi:hypothetical protein